MKEVTAPLYTAKNYCKAIIKGRGDLDIINSGLNHRLDNIERTSYEIIVHGIRSLYNSYKLVTEEYLKVEIIEIQEGEKTIDGLSSFFNQSLSLFENLYSNLSTDDMKFKMPHPASKRETEIHHILSTTIFHAIYHVGQGIITHQLAMDKEELKTLN